MDKEQLIKQYKKSIEELKEIRQKIFEMGFELKKKRNSVIGFLIGMKIDMGFW